MLKFQSIAETEYYVRHLNPWSISTLHPPRLIEKAQSSSNARRKWGFNNTTISLLMEGYQQNELDRKHSSLDTNVINMIFKINIKIKTKIRKFIICVYITELERNGGKRRGNALR